MVMELTAMGKTTLWALTILVTTMQRHKVQDSIYGLMMDFQRLCLFI